MAVRYTKICGKPTRATGRPESVVAQNSSFGGRAKQRETQAKTKQPPEEQKAKLLLVLRKSRRKSHSLRLRAEVLVFRGRLGGLSHNWL